MKYPVIAIALLAFAPSAHAIHTYAYYECKAGALTLKYDGPGTNYAFGGYSHFYPGQSESGILSYEDFDGDSDPVGTEIGDFGKLELIFQVTSSKDTSKRNVIPVDRSQCEGFDFEHSEWTSERKIRINDISEAASVVLGLQAGDELTFACQEEQDVPVRCDKE